MVIDVGEAEIKDGVLVWNAKDIVNFGHGRGYDMYHISEERYQDFPELVDYIENLKDNLKDAVTIKTEVRDIMRRHGWSV